MGDDLKKYQEAAINFGVTRKQRDFVAGNRFADELQELGLKMRVSAEGKNSLLDLLSNEDEYVRNWAAKDCLFFAPELAIPVLEELVQYGGLLSLSAMTILNEWRAGRLT